MVMRGYRTDSGSEEDEDEDEERQPPLAPAKVPGLQKPQPTQSTAADLRAQKVMWPKVLWGQSIFSQHVDEKAGSQSMPQTCT